MTISVCRWCGSTNLKFKERPDTPHYGEMYCGHCNKHSHWVSKPDSQKNPLRVNSKTIEEVCGFHGILKGGEKCFFCLRLRTDLGTNETLTIDHIEELNKGGEDQIWNMQVLCSACHKLKNWARLYLNWHFKQGEEDDTDTTTTEGH